MALADQLMADWTATGEKLDEFAELRSFRISDGAGGWKELKNLPILRDDSATMQTPIVTAQEVYIGDMKVNIRADRLPRLPIAGELIYLSEKIPTDVDGNPLEDRPTNLPY